MMSVIVNKKCLTCKRVLNNVEDSKSRDCGGDCLQCMADCGDPDCIEELRNLEKDKLDKQYKDIGIHNNNCSCYFCNPQV